MLADSGSDASKGIARKDRMTTGVLIVVLCAALLHAGWNAIVKASRDKGLSAVLVAAGSAALAALALPFVPWPVAAAWPFLLASTIAQSVYFPLVAAAYNTGDMSHAYPLMRGTAPLVVALLSLPLLGEALPPAAWAGIACICGGILALVLTARGKGSRQGSLLALLNAGIIASYTMIDGIGVRKSGSPVAYALCLSVLTAVPLLAWAIARHRKSFFDYESQLLSPS